MGVQKKMKFLGLALCSSLAYANLDFAMQMAVAPGAGVDCSAEIAKTIEDVYHRCRVVFGSPEGEKLDACVTFNVARIEMDSLKPKCANIDTVHDFYHKAFLVASAKNKEYQNAAIRAKSDLVASQNSLKVVQKNLATEKRRKTTGLDDALAQVTTITYQLDSVREDLNESEEDLGICKAILEQKNDDLGVCQNDLQRERNQLSLTEQELSEAKGNIDVVANIIGLQDQGWVDASDGSYSEILFYRQTYDTYQHSQCPQECKRLHASATLASIVNNAERNQAEAAMVYSGAWVGAEVVSGGRAEDPADWIWPSADNQQVAQSDDFWYGSTGTNIYYAAAWTKGRGLLNHWDPNDSYSRCLCEIRV